MSFKHGISHASLRAAAKRTLQNATVYMAGNYTQTQNDTQSPKGLSTACVQSSNEWEQSRLSFTPSGNPTTNDSCMEGSAAKKPLLCSPKLGPKVHHITWNRILCTVGDSFGNSEKEPWWCQRRRCQLVIRRISDSVILRTLTLSFGSREPQSAVRQ
ncbi:hypothetical protein ETH_00019885 [Eimeria tenella]|uniref:Uncharacterized protein n=1 Tax=Eimeria tenella TaxID=5802 RepID=U6KYH2_EIMTE|nr:hypothetical protein ETH_00019885 [Eimeria tenella]CDJ40540.1 hypothetical protein ETH_00019885 [Eimeria tenella]|eukprot:XP_013231290.1 hypothetical protein ETH_00019885 [Eimeria tenella]